jgi:hypothetical protein
MEYPKIETLYDRNPNFTVNTSAVRCDAFKLINQWHVTEKVDGTNVRITMLPDGNVRFGGRTDNAQMPVSLVNFLRETVTQETMQETFQRNSGEPWPTVTIFGEGYGEKIQSGGLYRKGVSLRIFDVLVDTWWLDLDDVAEVANKLGLLTVPYLGTIGTLPRSLDDLHALVHQSEVAKADGGPGCDAEGIVARTVPGLFMRNGERLMWKLKARDFVPGRR